MALFDRLAFERSWKSRAPSGRAELEQFNRGLMQWLERERLFPAFTPDERQLVLGPVGAWNNPTYLNVSWWMEAAGTLSWALGYVDALPPYDKQFDVDAFMNNFPSVEPIYERVSRARLRSMDVIQPARDVAVAHAVRSQRGSEVWSIATERLRALNWVCGVASWE